MLDRDRDRLEEIAANAQREHQAAERGIQWAMAMGVSMWAVIAAIAVKVCS